MKMQVEFVDALMIFLSITSYTKKRVPFSITHVEIKNKPEKGDIKVLLVFSHISNH